MTPQMLLPNPFTIVEAGRRFVPVPWERADVIHAALAKRGYRTTLCLNPETRQARLELWPGVASEDVLAVLEGRPVRRTTADAVVAGQAVWHRPKPSVPTPALAADLIGV